MHVKNYILRCHFWCNTMATFHGCSFCCCSTGTEVSLWAFSVSVFMSAVTLWGPVGSAVQQRSCSSSSCIYCVRSLLCHTHKVCQSARSHDVDPMNLQEDSDSEIWKCDNNNGSEWCHVKWGNKTEPVVLSDSTDSSHQWALTGFHHNITSSTLTHDVCHMSSIARFPIMLVRLRHTDTSHVLKIHHTICILLRSSE